jgi:hypothetical protein
VITGTTMNEPLQISNKPKMRNTKIVKGKEKFWRGFKRKNDLSKLLNNTSKITK